MPILVSKNSFSILRAYSKKSHHPFKKYWKNYILDENVLKKEVLKLN